MKLFFKMPLNSSSIVLLAAVGKDACELAGVLKDLMVLGDYDGELEQARIVLYSPGMVLPDCRKLPTVFPGLDFYETEIGLALQMLPGEEDRLLAVKILRIMVFGGWLCEMLRSRVPFTLFHGTLLEEESGSGMLLFGASEIGKTTTQNRWLAEGGDGCADDAILVYHEGGEFYCRPLPTWSRCYREGWAARCYPLNKQVRLSKLLWLTRGESDQEVVAAPLVAWHSYLLSALTLHLYESLQLFSAEDKRRIGERNWEFIEMLDRRFPPRTLRAHLEVPLKSVLEKN